MSDAMNLTDILEEIHKGIKGENLQVREIMDTLEHRGYGPLLLAASLLTVLPTGAIPGVPTVTAILILFITVQLVAGRKTPWFPHRLRELKIKKEKFEAARKKAEPYTKKIDFYLKPRLTLLTGKGFSRIVAVICVMLACAMPPLEFLPFAAAIPALAIALFGAGLSAKDGLLILVGFGVIGIGGVAIAVIYG